jgi:flagellar protein FliO/FliZ
MDGEFIASVIKIIIFLPIVLILAYLSLKLGGGRMMNMGGGKLIRIVERVPLSGKSFLCVAVIDDKPYVVSSTEEKIEILMELPSESLDKIKKGEAGIKENLAVNFSSLLKRKDRP